MCSQFGGALHKHICMYVVTLQGVTFGFNPDASLVVAFFWLFQARFEGSLLSWIQKLIFSAEMFS